MLLHVRVLERGNVVKRKKRAALSRGRVRFDDPKVTSFPFNVSRIFQALPGKLCIGSLFLYSSFAHVQVRLLTLSVQWYG